MESDETRIFNAAHLMVASLAGSLAHVTCKVFILALWAFLFLYLVICTVYLYDVLFHTLITAAGLCFLLFNYHLWFP